MSEPSPSGFGPFLPGWDFLQGLTRGASANAAATPPGLAAWLTPTLNVEELDKRIQELRTVQFWLEQNTHALKAAVQTLEVQRMTLATLQGLSRNAAASAPAADSPPPTAGAASAASPQGVTDPLAWWGTLTQQFQQIAAGALQDPAAQAALRQAGEMATGLAQQAMQSAGPATPAAAASAPKARAKPAARKRPARGA